MEAGEWHSWTVHAPAAAQAVHHRSAVAVAAEAIDWVRAAAAVAMAVAQIAEADMRQARGGRQAVAAV